MPQQPAREAPAGRGALQETVPGRADGPWRDLAAAVSLANLCFFRFWHKLLYYTPLMAPVWSWRDLLAITVNISAFAALFWCILTLGNRSRRFPGWHRGLYLLTPVILGRLLELRYFRQLDRLWDRVESSAVLILLSAVASLVAGYALVRWRRSLLAVAEVLTLCLFAFVPVTFWQAAWVIHQDSEIRRGGVAASAPMLPVRPGQPRVVWIIFDEMDWRYVFPQRPSSLRVPEMDRLRAQSIYAENTFQIGLETSEAMLSYLYGRQVYSVEPTGKVSFRLRFLDEPKVVDGPGPPDLFSKARQAGFNTAIVGWFLPYCRLFDEELNRCYWESMDTRVLGFRPSLATSFRSQLRNLSPLEVRQRHLRRHRAMLKEAEEAASDPKLGLVILHLPIPHQPAIYRRDHEELTLFNFRPDWYYDNLALADRTLGDLRRAMEQASVWDSTTIIVTTDHPLRWYAMLDETVDPHVPFLVKLAKQKQGILYRPPLRALVAHDLTLALLRGEVARPEEVVAWLDQHGFSPPVPAPLAH